METLTIERDKVEAAAKVSDTAAKVLKTLFPSAFPPVRKVGQVYRTRLWGDNCDFIIARIDFNEATFVCLTHPDRRDSCRMEINDSTLEIKEQLIPSQWKTADDSLIADSFEEYLKIRGAKKSADKNKARSI